MRINVIVEGGTPAAKEYIVEKLYSEIVSMRRKITRDDDDATEFIITADALRGVISAGFPKGSQEHVQQKDERTREEKVVRFKKAVIELRDSFHELGINDKELSALFSLLLDMTDLLLMGGVRA